MSSLCPAPDLGAVLLKQLTLEMLAQEVPNEPGVLICWIFDPMQVLILTKLHELLLGGA